MCENTLSAVDKTIFALLGTDESIHVDELVEKAELNSSEVLAALCEMERNKDPQAGAWQAIPENPFVAAFLPEKRR